MTILIIYVNLKICNDLTNISNFSQTYSNKLDWEVELIWDSSVKNLVVYNGQATAYKGTNFK